MEEWKVFLTLAEILALFFLVGKPILTLNSTISVLTTELRELRVDHDKQKEKSSAAHKEIYEHLTDNDITLADHEGRIKRLEEDK